MSNQREPEKNSCSASKSETQITYPVPEEHYWMHLEREKTAGLHRSSDSELPQASSEETGSTSEGKSSAE